MAVWLVPMTSRSAFSSTKDPSRHRCIFWWSGGTLCLESHRTGPKCGDDAVHALIRCKGALSRLAAIFLRLYDNHRPRGKKSQKQRWELWHSHATASHKCEACIPMYSVEKNECNLIKEIFLATRSAFHLFNLLASLSFSPHHRRRHSTHRVSAAFKISA